MLLQAYTVFLISNANTSETGTYYVVIDIFNNTEKFSLFIYNLYQESDKVDHCFSHFDC